MSNVFVLAGVINYKRVHELQAFLEEYSEDVSEELFVSITSEGGDEGCGRALAGIIKRAQDNGYTINTVGHGDIQSAAVIVFAAGQRRLLSKFATVMVHESTMEIEGNATDMKKHSKQMELDEQFWCGLMQDLTGTDAKTWLKLHESETYLRPDAALKLNLATEII